MLVSNLARCVALAALLVPSLGLAQSAPTAQLPPTAPAAPPAASPAAVQPASPAPSAATQAAVDQRIRTLQSQLGITEAQMPLWTAFAQAMRDNAASTDALFSQRAHAVTSMSAVDNMHSYAQIARAYADNTERLATAFDSLYASLTDTQRQAADTLFRGAGLCCHPAARSTLKRSAALLTLVMSGAGGAPSSRRGSEGAPAAATIGGGPDGGPETRMTKAGRDPRTPSKGVNK